MPWIDEAQWMWLLRKINQMDANLVAMMRSLNQKESAIMATLDDVLQEISDESSKIDSYEALFNGLQQQLTDALKNSGTVTPAMQAQIDAVFNAAKQNSDKIDAAISANAPPTPQQT